MSGIYYYTFNFLKLLLIFLCVNLFVISAKGKKKKTNNFYILVIIYKISVKNI